MHLNKIRLENFRNLSFIEIVPHKDLNIVYGDNGAGKSSLLEAIHVLGFGRSFRTNKPDTFIQNEKLQASAFCQYSENNVDYKLGFSRSKQDGYTFSINGEKSTKIVDVARQLPVQIFTPQSSDLILGAPLGRRRYIDWLLFHVEQSFAYLNARYQSCLSQRNALLKQYDFKDQDAFKQVDVWQNQLSELGEKISEIRNSYISKLNSEISAIYNEFYPEISVKLRYNRGWDKDLTMGTALERKLDRDLFRGSTSSGPHKADIQFIVDDKNAAEYMSRGQLRLLVSILLLAEVKLLKELKNKSSIFLIDDIAAELDEDTRKKFISIVLEQETQVFVTAIEMQQLAFTENYNNKKVFHVKQQHVIEE